MNVREILEQLEKCNEAATVSCIMQSREDGSFYNTEVIKTEMENNLVDIIVMDIQDRVITVGTLKSQLKLYEEDFRVSVKENRLTPIRFPYEIIGVENGEEHVFLQLPTLMSRFYED